MPDTAATPPWHLDLTNSVRTLGAAADELRTAHADARHTARAVDPARLIPVPGLVTSGGEFVRPHDEALWQLTDLYAAVEQRTRELYENAALAYAHGAAQAITSVLRAEYPHHVDLDRDASGSYVLTGELPNLDGSLTTAAGGPELAALRAHVLAAPSDDLADAAPPTASRPRPPSPTSSTSPPTAASSTRAEPPERIAHCPTPARCAPT